MNKTFSQRNKLRCESPSGFNHKLESWSGSDWVTAVMGELGEAANIQKKLNRVRDGIPGNKDTKEELRRKLARELADTYIYLDLYTQSQGIDLEAVVIEVFETKSREIGYREGGARRESLCCAGCKQPNGSPHRPSCPRQGLVTAEVLRDPDGNGFDVD